ncbi:serine/threonine-protein kinase [Actinomadura sp. WMMA1423]|uniref:serine/threonine-protein kinase n=1 Tax=Actinomadura sp. WMMA1423 TaxID=2591108 RepID=UPI001F110767|nr:serine/threonine-protein kinase [Actinomadura sp. WMMA1423]
MRTSLRDRDPRLLGPYVLTARLGRGGMGTVFLGEDDAGRQVAVKVINAELTDDEAFHDRFRREVTAARQVSRFCTAAVLDARLDGDPLYVVTEYVNGPSVEEAVKANGPLRGGDLEALAVNIATALLAIHGAGIVHRDLKPSNVLLSATGPRVIDFGIARALDATEGPTRTGQFVGTPAYIAPELMQGEEITPAADVFSWGCVVAYAGTGRAPFGGGRLHEVINRVMTADPDLEGLDPAVHDVVARSLAKDPAKRPTVKQLIQALTGEDEPPATPPTVELPPPAPAPAPGPPLMPPPGPAPAPTPAAGQQPAPSPETEAEQRPAPSPEPAAQPKSAPPPESAAQLESATPPPPAAEQEPVPPIPATEQGSVPAPEPAVAAAMGADAVPPTSPAGISVPAPRAKRPARHRKHGLLAVAAGVVAAAAMIGALGVPDGDGSSNASGSGATGLGDEPPEVKDKIFDDGFSHEDSGWKTAATPDWDASYQDKEYEVRVLPNTASTTVGAPVSRIPESQLMGAKVFPADPNGEAGVFCRGSSGYAFLLRADGRARIARLASGQAQTLASGRVRKVRDEYRLQAACVKRGDGGIDLAMWVNGDPVASSTATPPPGAPGWSGLLAVRSEGSTGLARALFDDFALCEV